MHMGQLLLKALMKIVEQIKSWPLRILLYLDISKINNIQDPDILMLMFNLLENSSNYSMTSRSLWNYHRDEMNDMEMKIMLVVVIK